MQWGMRLDASVTLCALVPVQHVIRDGHKVPMSTSLGVQPAPPLWLRSQLSVGSGPPNKQHIKFSLIHVHNTCCRFAMGLDSLNPKGAVDITHKTFTPNPTPTRHACPVLHLPAAKRIGTAPRMLTLSGSRTRLTLPSASATANTRGPHHATDRLQLPLRTSPPPTSTV
jgi:hypothetical protein